MEYLRISPHDKLAVEKYIVDRVSELHKTIEQESDTTAIYRAQGQIQELRRLGRSITSAVKDGD